MTDQRAFETRLAGAFERYVAGAPIEIDAVAFAGTVLGVSPRAAHRDSLGLDPRWRAILLAAALVLASLVAIGVGTRLWTTISTLEPPSTPSTPSMEAIYVRSTGNGDVDIVLARPDGTESVLRSLSSSLLPDGLLFAPSALVSEDGWIALGTERAPGEWSGGCPGGCATFGWALIDLGDATPAVRGVETTGGPSSAWSPNGHFASPYGNTCCAMQFTDPRTGETVRIGSTFLPGSGPDTIWAADGSGVLVRLQGPAGTNRYGLQPRSGEPPQDYVPELAFRGPRYVVAGGEELVVPASGRGLLDDVTVPVDWMDDELLRFMDASFSADGRSQWLLYLAASPAGKEAILARKAPGVVTTVWRRPLPADVDRLDIGTFALDDSIVVIWLSHTAGPDDGDWRTEGLDNGGRRPLLVALPEGTASAPSGAFAGFVRGSVVASWR